jgi:hypothetical protein
VDNEDDESDSYGIYSVSKKAKDAIVIKPCVEKVNIPMELDTGSAVSAVISFECFHDAFRKQVCL